jgi:hypothetical protein
MVPPKTCREKRKHAIVVHVRRNRTWKDHFLAGATLQSGDTPGAQDHEEVRDLGCQGA